MAIRFIIGRAGSGKTEYCLTQIRDGLQDDTRSGKRFLMIVPEQASQQTEYSLLHHPSVGATHRAEVLSFQRLAFKLLQSRSKASGAVLTRLGKIMLLRRILDRNRESLQYYLASANQYGFFDELSSLVTEFIHENVQPEELESLIQVEQSDDPLRPLKLADLSMVYAAYMKALGDDLQDPSRYLEFACQEVPGCPWLKDTHIWVDGFAGFTGQQKSLLVELARVAPSLEITAMVDPGCVRESQGSKLDPEGLFTKTARMHSELSACFHAEQLDVNEPLVLKPEVAPRFSRSSGLRDFERLYGSVGAGSEEIARSVSVVQLAGRRAESDWVAADIWHRVRECPEGDRPLRYRDIAVITRDLEPYADLLQAAFAERKIPCFIDQRRPMRHHPLVELLKGLVNLSSTAWSCDVVRLLLKTGLLPLADDASDELENYLLEYGIHGPEAWQDEAGWIVHGQGLLKGKGGTGENEYNQVRQARLNESRRAFRDSVKEWMEATQRKLLTGREWVVEIHGVLERLNVAEQLNCWATQAQDAGDLDLAEQHRQIVRDVSAFLEDCCVSLGEEDIAPRDFSDIMTEGLKHLSLGLAPSTLDQVLVGSIERSRHPDIRLAYIIGFNEGAYPRTGSEHPILNDDDRSWLSAHGVRLASGMKEQVREEPILAYTALTRASECIVVTFPVSDEQGKQIRPSPYLESLLRLAPGLAVRVVSENDRHRDWTTLCTSREVAGRLALEFRNRDELADESADFRGAWNDLYMAALGRPVLLSEMEKVLPGLVTRNHAELSKTTVGRLIPDTFHASVSRLELFASCPFKHFARYTLNLEERKEAELQEAGFGTICHAILEQYFNGLIQDGKRIADLEDDELRQRLDEVVNVVIRETEAEGSLTGARDHFLVQQAAKDLYRVLLSQRYVATEGAFSVFRTEVPFGMKSEESLASITLQTSGGHHARLRGLIDRVDLAEDGGETLGVVIDYKRRGKTLSLANAYHGLSLQLPGYLLILADRGEELAGRPIVPVGAFYLGLTDQYDSVETPEAATEYPCRPNFRLRGLFDVNYYSFLEKPPKSTKAECYSLYINKDEVPGNLANGDWAMHGDFQSFLAYMRRTMGNLVDHILDGEIDVTPIRMGSQQSACSWCPYSRFCRFDFFSSDARYLESLKRQDVFERCRDSSVDA